MSALDYSDLPIHPVSRWRIITAILIVIVPIYTYLIWSHISRAGVYTLDELLYYPLVFGGGWSLFLLAVYRFLCGKRMRQLNRRSATWWKDILMGIGLGAGMLILFIVQQRTINPLFPQQPPPPAMLELLGGLTRDPLLLAIWIGPVVWIGVAIFEELQRAFLLDLWWDLGSAHYMQWMAILTSAALFALAHIYQGPANMVGIFVLAVFYGLFYLKVGRLWPMIIAHGLYDSLQITMAVVQIRQAGL